MISTRNIAFIFLAICFFTSCQEKANKNTLNADEFITDSFTININDFNSVCQFINFANAHTINSFDPVKNEIETYQLKGNTFVLDSTQNIRVNQRVDFYFFTPLQGKYYLTDAENNWTIVDSATKQSQFYKRTATIPFIGQEYRLGYNRQTPLIKQGNTLYCQYTSPAGTAQIDEHIMASFTPQNGVIDNISNYLDKPKALYNYVERLHMYCVKDSIVSLLFPCFDTLYRLNITTGMVTKKVLQNKHFCFPAQTQLNVDDPNYFSDLSKYTYANFMYYGIQYNPATGHYVAYYRLPVKHVKDRNIVDTDQPLQAIVMDSDYNILNYVLFKPVYDEPFCFVVHPTKGIAIPLLKEPKTNAKNFYYFNF